ncbi:hypothetical protein HK100_012732 [Physocladia obscura]|uniref:Uncharacterized protein n=1 Tax=Physocladia obscura TaxID=109957 RepID=A0AAD5T1X3_9FUNG|nr:hypothetical protein HK100_012732 [Physocladia obscura]
MAEEPIRIKKRCLCGNVSVEVTADATTKISNNDQNSPVRLIHVSKKLLYLTGQDDGWLWCIACGIAVLQEVGAEFEPGAVCVVLGRSLVDSADFVSSGDGANAASKLSSASSACYGIEIRDGDSATDGGVLRLSANEKHGRKIDVRRAFDVFREAVMRDAEATVRLAQAECAWLCDRIAALPSAPASPTPELATQQTTTIEQSQQHTNIDPIVSPISKEPFALSSSSPVAASSLLSRHLGAAPSSVVAQVGPPILEHLPSAAAAITSTAAPEHPHIFSASSSSSVNLSRKVHFKEEPTTAASTIATAATPVASSFSLNETNKNTILLVEDTASSVDPMSSSSSLTKPRRPVPTSPAPTNGQKIVFSKQHDTDSSEDVFSIDDAASSSTTIERYLGDDEDDDDDDNDYTDNERDDKPPISLLSSSMPITIARDPRGGDLAAYERKPKKMNANNPKQDFIAPYEIVAKSYQAQAEISGSVVGRPFPSTFKKNSVAI